ncbi:hypothetical protein C9J41_15375 [Photobacterium sp. GB-50]|nr:hypothetical protein C9J41_15375 [Photobacterium sp. GB-50]
MDIKDFTALLKILRVTLLLCIALIIMANMGMFSSMPIMVKEPLITQFYIDYIHVLYYFAFNGLFVGFLISLLMSFKHTKTQTKNYIQQH